MTELTLTDFTPSGTMGHIVFQPEHDQGPLLGRVSLAMYTVAVAFVALRYVVN